jgi:hypothetical protein
VPAGMSAAAVSKAGDVANEDLIRPEGVPVRASRRRVGDPLPGRGLHQLAKHGFQAIRVHPSLTETPPENIESCNSNSVAMVSGGTSNGTLT